MFNIVRIDGTTKKKHIVHPRYETQDAGKSILRDMAAAYLKAGLVIEAFELSFVTTQNGDIFRVEKAEQFRTAA